MEWKLAALLLAPCPVKSGGHQATEREQVDQEGECGLAKQRHILSDHS